jgi:hypothetical protein
MPDGPNSHLSKKHTHNKVNISIKEQLKKQVLFKSDKDFSDSINKCLTNNEAKVNISGKEGHQFTQVYFVVKVPVLSLTFIKNIFNRLFKKSQSPVLTKEVHGFTIATLEYFKKELAEDLAEHNMQHGDTVEEFITMANELAKTITYSETIDKLRERYIQINRFVWVNTSDPSIMIVDENVHETELDTGMSNKQICQTIWLWFALLFNESIKVTESSQNETSQKLLK